MKVMKVCFVGADGTGKTSLILRYTKNMFSNSYLPTIGCDFYDITISNDLQIFLWDIASQKNFEKMRQYYLASSHLGVICVDIMRHTEEFIDPWIQDIKSYVGKDCPFLIVVNKIDLMDSEGNVEAIIQKIEKKYGTKVFYTSAKTGQNVTEMFELIGKTLVDMIKK